MKFYVKCKNKERLDKVLEKAEKLGYTWNAGKKPTRWKPHSNCKIVLFFNVEDKTISFGTIYQFKQHGAYGYEKKKYKDFIVENEYFNGKAVCVESNNDFITKGKIYEFVDGKAIDDEGNELPKFDKVTDINELNERMWSNFIEVVE